MDTTTTLLGRWASCTCSLHSTQPDMELCFTGCHIYLNYESWPYQTSVYIHKAGDFYLTQGTSKIFNSGPKKLYSVLYEHIDNSKIYFFKGILHLWPRLILFNRADSFFTLWERKIHDFRKSSFSSSQIVQYHPTWAFCKAYTLVIANVVPKWPRLNYFCRLL